jgi:hypothetical protein
MRIDSDSATTPNQYQREHNRWLSYTPGASASSEIVMKWGSEAEQSLQLHSLIVPHPLMSRAAQLQARAKKHS